MTNGRNRMPEGSGLGLGGACRCPSCKYSMPHKRGVPCYTLKCPKCGTKMTRA